MPYLWRKSLLQQTKKKDKTLHSLLVENCPETEILKSDIVSEIHDKVTQTFADWIKEQFPEIQFKHISNPEFLDDKLFEML